MAVAATSENLNSAFASSGISVAEARSDPATLESLPDLA